MPSTQSVMNWYRGAIRGKTRIGLAWIFATIVVFSTRDYPNAISLLICLLGASLRFWASGFLRKDERPAVGGPYAYLRNPLYMGTYLMAAGTTLANWNWILFVGLTAIYFGVYHFIVHDEEQKLKPAFGEPYERYLSSVPRFLPRLSPLSETSQLAINPDPAARSFNWEIAGKNKAHEAYLAFIGLWVFMFTTAFCWKNLI